MYDYPSFDALNYLIMLFISFFTKNASAIMNIFYLLTFPLSAMTAMFALLELKCSNSSALFASQLFPFMAYHFFRNETHLLLSAYYMVPLGILVVLWYMQGDISMSISRSKSISKNLFDNRKYLLSVLFCFMISSTGIYYAFFTCFFLFLAIFKKIIDEKGFKRSASLGISLLLVIIAGGIANYFPTILYHLRGGEYADTLARAGESAEIYGLKIIDLFMPTATHHDSRVATLVDLFHSTEPLANENTSVSLGALVSLAFSFLLIIPLFSFKETSHRKKLIRNTSILSYAGIILATTGGISALICRLIFSGIRAYNRIGVFIFFLALVSGTIILDTFFGNTVKDQTDAETVSPKVRFKKASFIFLKYRKWLQVLLIPLLVLALYDQIPGMSIQPYEANKQQDIAVQAYFRQIEDSVTQGSYIYQLPYVSFPEPAIAYGSGPYSHLAGYLNTTELHWSYGALTGTESDQWARTVSQMPAVEMIAVLEAAGYEGIYVDLSNYPDDGMKNIVSQLAGITNKEPLWSQDKQQAFISIN